MTANMIFLLEPVIEKYWYSLAKSDSLRNPHPIFSHRHAKTLLPGSPSYAVKGVAITSTSNIPYEMTKEREEAGACHEYETVNMPPETTPLDLKGIYKIPYLPPIPAIPLPVATPPSWKVGMAGEEEEELYENIPGDQ